MDTQGWGTLWAQDGGQRHDRHAEQQGQEQWPTGSTLSSPRSLFLSKGVQGSFGDTDSVPGNASNAMACDGVLPGLKPSAASFGSAAHPPFLAARSLSDTESWGGSEMNHAADLFSSSRDDEGEGRQGSVSLGSSEKPDDLFVWLPPPVLLFPARTHRTRADRTTTPGSRSEQILWPHG